MEELIDQFKLVTEGMRPPAGEVYHAVEGGERRARLLSGEQRQRASPGSAAPRSPSFSNMQALHDMIQGALLADIVPTFDMINMIGGECDR